MESNGVPNRVHVSQSTADLLIAEGKSSWLEARKDKVVAKGKGAMQTWFVTAQNEKSVASSMSIATTDSDGESTDDMPAATGLTSAEVFSAVAEC